MPDQPPHRVSADAVLRQATAPWHARAMGIAVGCTVSVTIAALTLFHGLAAPANAPDLALLGQLFYGYTVSWPGVAVGATWGFAAGFATGWLTATLVNFFQATWPLVAKIRHDASEPIDFLDRI
ncbi:MAG TPA: hypothetical protein VIY56_09000 [Vicinamibacterales bacterium]